MHIISNSLKKYNELGPDCGTRWVVCEKRRKFPQKVREHFLLVLRRKGNSISSVFQKYHLTMAKRNYHEVLLLFRRVLSPSFSEEGLHCVILVGETPDGEPCRSRCEGSFQNRGVPPLSSRPIGMFPCPFRRFLSLLHLL